MKEATKNYLKYRPNAKFIGQSDSGVEHRPNKDYKKKHCIEESRKEARKSGGEVVLGVLIAKYRKDVGATPVILHHWNKTKDGKHYDTLPNDILTTNAKDRYDYVEDPDINKPYRYKNTFLWPPQYYINDTLRIMLLNGQQGIITDEEHKRFWNENKKDNIKSK